MSLVDRYILRISLGPFLFFLLTVTGIALLAHSLRYVDDVANSGSSAWAFIELCFLISPFLLGVATPISIFAASLYALNRLWSDSEAQIMFAMGISGLRLARPFMLLGSVVGVAMALNLIWLVPLTNSTISKRLEDLKGDIVASIAVPGSFLHPSKNVTVFVGDNLGEQGLRGVVIDDQRDPDNRLTYLANSAVIVYRDNIPELTMLEGTTLLRDGQGNISVLSFESFSLQLSQLATGSDHPATKISEMPTHLLIRPAAGNFAPSVIGQAMAEGHERISLPLYALALPLIAIACFFGGPAKRNGYSQNIFLALAIGVLVRITGMAIRSAAYTEPLLAYALYLPPLLGIAGALYFLQRGRRKNNIGNSYRRNGVVGS